MINSVKQLATVHALQLYPVLPSSASVHSYVRFRPLKYLCFCLWEYQTEIELIDKTFVGITNGFVL